MLPLPKHYDPQKVGVVYRVNYEEIASGAADWRSSHSILPAKSDNYKTWLMLIDVQNTFCIPGFELFVGGRSGAGAVDDSRRLSEFIYHNLAAITEITATLDTHGALQIFHPLFFVDKHGANPAPYTDIHLEDILSGKWSFNPDISAQFGISTDYGQKLVTHYASSLEKKGKYALTIWPYHAMLGGIGHALVSAIEEALFFHSVVRLARPDFEIKGNNPFTENYSVIGPEVLDGPTGEHLGAHTDRFLHQLEHVDRLVIAGQAKSHCVAWTVADLLEDIQHYKPELVKKIYLLSDCTSPVVVPGVADYTAVADDAFAKFASAGAHIVESTIPIAAWPE